jgi:lysophospholipase L1-like esterase
VRAPEAAIGLRGNGAHGVNASTSRSGTVPIDPALMSRCTGSNPIVCTIPVPANGNYNVTVELGGAGASTSRVQAELYRIVVPEISLPAGTYSQQTFSVNVRAEMHDGYSAPGKELNLRIDGAAPALHGLGFVAAPSIPTIFLAGDSTVCDWDPAYSAANAAGPLERGWAQELSQFLKPGIAVANYADSGETAPGFYGKFWGPAKAALRAGDYVFIQFGHNDQKTETTSSFKTALLRYISDARAGSATPVLLTPPGRKSATTASTGFNGFDQATRDLAKAENITLVDLTNLSINYYKTVSDKSVIFTTASESTHFSEIGATALSKLVITELKASPLSLKDLIR